MTRPAGIPSRSVALVAHVALVASFALGAFLALDAGPARATEAPSLDEERQAQLDLLRAEVANQIQLQAYDLLDELVYGWLEAPVFGVDTPVIIAEVTVPVGMGSGLETLIENHLAGLLIKNPGTHLVLTHCPACGAWIARSSPKGTIVSRGVDQPEALRAAAGSVGGRHALFLDFEAEGTALVLRSRIVSLADDDLRIVASRSLSTSTTRPALLRSGDRLKSAADARREYMDLLAGRGNVSFPVRLGVRSYASPPDQQLSIVPQPWLAAGVEIALGQARAWTSELVVGASYFPSVHTGFLVEGRVARLLTGKASSLTAPDLYGFVGASVIGIHGPGAFSLREKVPDVADLLLAASGAAGLNALTIYPTIELGVSLRLGNRIGVAAFMETLPTMGSVPTLGRYLDMGFIGFHTIGGEVSFCF